MSTRLPHDDGSRRFDPVERPEGPNVRSGQGSRAGRPGAELLRTAFGWFRTVAPRQPVHATASATIRRSPTELYEAWHDFERLPRFMYHLDSVRVVDGHSHWTATGPAGTRVEWDAEVVEDRPDSLIAWRSVAGSQIDNTGRVRFVPAPGDRGTEVHISLDYHAPGGSAAVAVAKLLGEEPGQQIADELRRFKQLMEVGEIVRSEGSPAGARASNQLHQRPAQPLG